MIIYDFHYFIIFANIGSVSIVKVVSLLITSDK